MGFDGGNIIQDAHMDDTLYVKNPDASDLLLEDPVNKGRGDKAMNMDFDSAARGDGFGSGMGDFGMHRFTPILTGYDLMEEILICQAVNQHVTDVSNVFPI